MSLKCVVNPSVDPNDVGPIDSDASKPTNTTEVIDTLEAKGNLIITNILQALSTGVYSAPFIRSSIEANGVNGSVSFSLDSIRVVVTGDTVVFDEYIDEEVLKVDLPAGHYTVEVTRFSHIGNMSREFSGSYTTGVDISDSETEYRGVEWQFNNTPIIFRVEESVINILGEDLQITATHSDGDTLIFDGRGEHDFFAKFDGDSSLDITFTGEGKSYFAEIVCNKGSVNLRNFYIEDGELRISGNDSSISLPVDSVGIGLNRFRFTSFEGLDDTLYSTMFPTRLQFGNTIAVIGGVYNSLGSGHVSMLDTGQISYDGGLTWEGLDNSLVLSLASTMSISIGNTIYVVGGTTHSGPGRRFSYAPHHFYNSATGFHSPVYKYTFNNGVLRLETVTLNAGGLAGQVITAGWASPSGDLYVIGIAEGQTTRAVLRSSDQGATWNAFDHGDLDLTLQYRSYQYGATVHLITIDGQKYLTVDMSSGTPSFGEIQNTGITGYEVGHIAVINNDVHLFEADFSQYDGVVSRVFSLVDGDWVQRALQPSYDPRAGSALFVTNEGITISSGARQDNTEHARYYKPTQISR